MWCRLNVVVPPAAGGIPPDLLNKGAWCITWTDVVLTFCINSTREPRDVRMRYTRRPPWCSGHRVGRLGAKARAQGHVAAST
jgi:hypothetical protein